MAGSAAEAPTTPDAIRASDEEREKAVSELSERFAEGRLSHETFLRRMDEALGAQNRRQLDGLFTDLPGGRRGLSTLAALRDGLRERTRRGLDLLAAEKEALAGAVRDSFRPRAAAAVPPAWAASPAALFFPPVVRDADNRYTIGRDSECDLLIEDLSVSRRHARLERIAGGWMLADLGSTNGTRLNGWRVRRPVPLQAGDRVAFGTAEFVMCADQRDGMRPAPGDPGPGPG